MTHQAERGGTPEAFPRASEAALRDVQMRRNVRRAASTIREKRAAAVAEVPDWAGLCDAAAAIKERSLVTLDERLVELERTVSDAGGTVYWATDGESACALVAQLVAGTGAREVVKVKSLTTDEIGLNVALEASGIQPIETDLAEFIVQLARERPSHLLVPAVHKNRAEIRDLFREHLGLRDLTDEPAELASAARSYLRSAFLRAKVAVSGANFAVSQTGTVCIVESEGNGRMCTTLPDTLITIMGIEKVIERWSDLGILLQVLPRSSTGERMNPYTSLWTGVAPSDGPRSFHLVLLDAGRSRALADDIGREALRCIRCSACINVCPVYEQIGGHAYHTPYAGPIGAVLQPLLSGSQGQPGTLPFASTLCGACADVCPVRIDLPRLLVDGRAKAVASTAGGLEAVSMRRLGVAFLNPRAYGRLQRLGYWARLLLPRGQVVRRLPLGPVAAWARSRELPGLPSQSFRQWWEATHEPETRGPDRPTSGRARLPWRPAVRRDGTTAPVERRANPSDRVAFGVGTRSVADEADARGVVLGCVRGALDGTGRVASVSARVAQHPDTVTDLVGLFTARVEEYGARAVPASDVSATVTAILAAEPGSIIVAPTFPSAWMPADSGCIVVDDERIGADELDRIHGSLTTCAGACAETGTIAFDSGPGQGRRMMSLIPDLHVCVVRENQIVESVPRLLDILADAPSSRRPVVLVSGPSATSDIELNRVEGVHGPRKLVVVIARDNPPDSS